MEISMYLCFGGVYSEMEHNKSFGVNLTFIQRLAVYQPGSVQRSRFFMCKDSPEKAGLTGRKKGFVSSVA